MFNNTCVTFLALRRTGSRSGGRRRSVWRTGTMMESVDVDLCAGHAAKDLQLVSRTTGWAAMIGQLSGQRGTGLAEFEGIPPPISEACPASSSPRSLSSRIPSPQHDMASYRHHSTSLTPNRMTSALHGHGEIPPIGERRAFSVKFIPTTMILPNFAAPIAVSGLRHGGVGEAQVSQRRRQACRFFATARPTSAGEVVKKFWDLQRNGKFRDTNYLFAPHAVYHDRLYSSAFEGYEAIDKHLSNMEDVLPASIVFVLDDIAAAKEKVGARWHAETGEGTVILFSRGASMYTVEKDGEGGMWITEAWDFVETPFKVAGIVLPVFRLASSVLKLFGGKGGKSGKKEDKAGGQ